MTDTTASTPSRALFIVAGLLTAALMGLLIFAALSQNLYSFVATFTAYSAEGDTLWAVESDIDGAPHFTADGAIVFTIRGDATTVNADGEVVGYERTDDDAKSVTVGGVVYTQQRDGPNPLLVVEQAVGVELWRAEGAEYVDAGAGIAVIMQDREFRVVEAATGDLLHTYEGLRNRRPVAGDGIAAYTGEGSLTVVTLEGVRRFSVDGMPRAARVVFIESGIIVVEGFGGTHKVSGFDQVTGDEAWRRSIDDYARYDPLGPDSPLGSVDLVVTDGFVGGRWARLAGPENSDAWLVTAYQRLRRGGVRYLQHGAGTIAIDEAGTEVLWVDRTGFPVGVSADSAAFRTADSFRMVAAQTGELLAEVPAGDGARVALGAGQMLVSNDGRVTLANDKGELTVLADLEPKAKARAVSSEYALVTLPRDGPGRRYIFYDIASGERVFADALPPAATLRFDGEMVILRHGPNRESVIDLKLGEMVDRRAATIPGRARRVTEVAMVFDSERRSVLWEHELGQRSAAGVFNDHVIVIRVGRREAGTIWYE